MAVTVTAAMVKALRDITQAGVMDCKKALIEAEGNQEAAVEILRKAGLAMAAKKSGRIAAEGLVNYVVSEDGKKAAIVEVNSETDFVAKNELFRNFVAKVAKQALTTKATTVEELKAEPWIEDPTQTVGDALVALVAVIHENLQIRRFETFESEDYIATYLHGQGKIGVLVDMGCQEVNDVVKDAGKHVAMQVCAMNPQFLPSKIPPASPAATMLVYSGPNTLGCWARASARDEPPLMDWVILWMTDLSSGFSHCSSRMFRH